MASKNAQRAISAVNKIINENKPVSQALKESGYGRGYYRNPQQFTRTKQFQTILDKAGLSDIKLANKHNQLLNSKKEDISLRSLDLAYKVKGKYENASGATFNAPVQIVIRPLEAPKSPVEPLKDPQ